MVALVSPNTGDVILASHITQLTGLIAGSSGKGQVVQFTDKSDTTNYTNTFGNKDTTNGRAVKILYGDTGGSPVTLATFQKSGSRIQSNDGTDYIDVSNSGVAVTGAFSINGQAVGSGVRVYNVLDYGIITGSTSSPAANNTTLLQALWVTVATAGGGVVYFPPGTYPLNATTLDHALSYGVSMTLAGSGASTILSLYGSAGPWLYFASSSASQLNRSYLRDIRIEHAATTASGATIQLGSVSQFWILNVIMPNAGSTLASLNPVRLVGTATGIHIRSCKFEARTDYATLVSGGLTPYGLEVVTSSAGGGLFIDDTEFSGAYTGSAGRGTGIRFVNTALFDTVWLGPGTLIKDWATGMTKTGGAGAVTNFVAVGMHFDGCATQNVQLDPVATGGVPNSTWIFSACWFSALTYNIVLAESGGALSGLTFDGCYFTGVSTAAFSISTGVDNIRIVGNDFNCDALTAGNFAVSASGTINCLIVNDNRILVTATTAGGCITVDNVGCDPLMIQGNVMQGGADADGVAITGALSASRIYAAAQNAYKA